MTPCHVLHVVTGVFTIQLNIVEPESVIKWTEGEGESFLISIELVVAKNPKPNLNQLFIIQINLFLEFRENKISIQI